MGMSINNVVGFIWAVFSGIITLRLANPLYNVLFSTLDWSGSLTATLTKYSLMLIFGIIIFGVAFFIPFKVFTTITDGMAFGGEDQEYYNG